MSRGPRGIADRLRRLLVMLPWLMERGEVSVAEMAARFEVTEAELVRDLELAAMCGLPPFVDEMVDLFIDEGTVYAGVPRVFTRPLRLTAPEGFALLAASRVSMQLPGADPGGALSRALAKLEVALGADAVVVDTPAPDAAEEITAAVEAGERVRIGYWSAASDRRTERDITPRRVLVDRGFWYVVADDHASGEVRTFRLDRIDGIERTGIVDAPHDVAVPTGDDWFAGSDLPVARVWIGRNDEWVIGRYPAQSVREVDGGWELEVTVTRESWLRGLLLRVGPDARVIDPPEWRDLARTAAAAVLARYEAGGSSAS